MVLALDCENTTWNTGNPFDIRNFNVCISYATENSSGVVFENREDFSRLFEQSTLLVGFNLKYDLHWLRKLGYDFSNKRVFDCQVAEYLLSRQTFRYPDLDTCAKKYTGEGKSTVVETEYWAKGINTHEIPRNILAEYAEKDALLTYRVYQKQQELIPAHQRILFSLTMQDLLVLQEMEYNGLHFDRELSLRKAHELETEITELQTKLNIHHNVPDFNWGSVDHLSALLYGGTIKKDVRVPIGVYKSGKKEGEVRFKIETETYNLPRKYTPVRGSALKKEGLFSVEEDYLRKLKGDHTLIDGILRIKELAKKNNTYYNGLVDRQNEMNWPLDRIHGQFNQCVTSTGRLSSSKPSLQNFEGDVKEIFPSRFGER